MCVYVYIIYVSVPVFLPTGEQLPGLALSVPSYIGNTTSLLSPDSLRVLACNTSLLYSVIELPRSSSVSVFMIEVM